MDTLADNKDSIENILIHKEQKKYYEELHQRFNKFLDARELDILIKHRIEEPRKTLEEISVCYGLIENHV